MKSTYVVVFFAIVGITSPHLYAMDFLNDPFFKQLAGELDSMFGTGPMDAAPAPAYAPAKPAPFGGGFGAKKPAAGPAQPAASATPAEKAVADAAKDLKTLFLENLEGSKPKAGAFGAPAPKQTKIVITKKRVEAYNHYMGDLVKKTRLVERIVASNPARTFGVNFLTAFDEVANVVDKIEIIHQLILSKKMYLRNFFGQPMQKTREQIVALMPKIDATLRTLRPLLTKEESLDDDISRMKQEASSPATPKASAGKKKDAVRPRHGAAPATQAPSKISRSLRTSQQFGWPKPTRSGTAPATPPKRHAVPPPVKTPGKAQSPANFSLKKFMHEKGVS